jgi:hypothetical protein
MVVDMFRHRHDTALRVSALAQSIVFQHLEAARETRGHCISSSPPNAASWGDGGRTWWAHFTFTCLNIAPTIRRKKIEETRSISETRSRTRDSLGVAVVHAPAARIAAWGRFRNDGAPARNHGAIMLSKIMQPNAELGMNGQMGFPHR